MIIKPMIIKPFQFYVVTCEISPRNFYDIKQKNINLNINDVLIILKEIDEQFLLSKILCFYKGKIIKILSSWLENNAQLLTND
jgi:hypothetical protein